LKPE
jgi:hypothetical protein